MNKTIVIFVVFSFVGWVWESIYCTICERKWANRGFLYGPICPIYGCGCVLSFFTYSAIEKGILPDLAFWQIFLIGFIGSMFLEYPTSWLLEKLFHARWWDYSNMPLNINGRTSVPSSVVFGVMAVLIVRWVMPFTESLLSAVPAWAINLAAIVFTSVLTADVTLTVSALSDFQKIITEAEVAFQNQMESVVDQIMNTRNHVFHKAVNRIRVFKLPTGKNEIAQRIRDGKIRDLVKRYIETPEGKNMDERN